MPEFAINLIRGQVPPRARRKLRYRAMIAYLAASGLMLAVTLWLATSRLTQAAVVREDIVRLERYFVAAHPEQDGIAAYAAWLERVAGERVAKLKAVDGLLGSAPRPAELIGPLALSLPAGMSIRSLAMDAEQTVTFELMVVPSGTEAETDPSGLMERWSRDATLGSRLQGVTYLGGTRQSNGERNDMVWRFSGRVARKDS